MTPTVCAFCGHERPIVREVRRIIRYPICAECAERLANHPMTTIEERAARLREGRAHGHCECGYVSPSGEMPTAYIHMRHAIVYCTDDHNPTETALDALALAYDVVSPVTHPVWYGAIREELADLYVMVAKNGGER